MQEPNKKLRIFTWHIHGSYLYYLTQTNCEFFVPYKTGNEEGYGGKTGNFPWGENLHQVNARDVKDLSFDIILFQSQKNYLVDQHEILSEKQRQLPKIYLEHDPPREQPTDTKHIVDDPKIQLVHVTHFNNLMWDNNATPTTVIEHGVRTPDILYTGEIEKGIVVINNIAKRGRRLGFDIFEQVRKEIPLDIAGMGTKELGGLGDIPHEKLFELLPRYRFFFNPIRYTSLGLSVCEAMMIGLPILGLATTEMPVTIENSVTGFVHTDITLLIEKMRFLLRNHEEAKKMSRNVQKAAFEKFSIKRFAKDWGTLFTKISVNQ